MARLYRYLFIWQFLYPNTTILNISQLANYNIYLLRFTFSLSCTLLFERQTTWGRIQKALENLEHISCEIPCTPTGAPCRVYPPQEDSRAWNIPSTPSGGDPANLFRIPLRCVRIISNL